MAQFPNNIDLSGISSRIMTKILAWKALFLGLDPIRKGVVVVAALLVLTLFWKGCSGDSYKLKLPRGAKRVKTELATKEETAQMNTSHYTFISNPVHVTQKGEEHVQLDKMAKVSFPIPKNIKKKDYINLMGVLITDDGPVYMVPDYDGIRKGVVSFETSHFCWAGATVVIDEKRRELFIERTAAGEWKANACEMDLEKTVKEKLTELGKQFYLGERDFLGIAAREVLKDNGFVKDVLDLVDSYDKGDTEAMAELAKERVVDKLATKSLALLFKQLKGDYEVELADVDKDRKKFKYTTTTMPGRNHELVTELEKHLGVDGMKKVGTRLGRGDHPYVVAYEFYKEIRSEKLKQFSISLIPQIKVWQTGARVMRVLKEFWTSNEMVDMYNQYAKDADSDGRMDNSAWNIFAFRRLNAAKSKYGLSEQEIRAQFEERYRRNWEIEQRKARLREIIALYEDTGRFTLLDAEIFDKMKYDYIQRLTRIHFLVERFRKELCNKNGELPYKTAGATVNEELCRIVEVYLKLYPDQQKFYKWLAKKGYYEEKFNKDYDQLNSVRSWYLIKVETTSTENSLTDEGSDLYSANPGLHKHVVTWKGTPFEPDPGIWYRPHTSTFTSTIEAPPEWMEAGDSIVLHTTINLDAIENGWYILGGSSVYFEKEEIGMGFLSRSAIKATVANQQGATTVGTRYGFPHTGEWDFVLHIPSGRKDELRAINFDSIGSRTHWVYKWASIFEKDE